MEKPNYHVLALSGGGYRGLYTATVLREIERALGQPLARHFDLICGTSVGGLLAMGLAHEIPTERLQSLFVKHGNDIFGSRDWRRKILTRWFNAKHSAEGLSKALQPYFEDTRMGDLKHPVLITSVNYTTGKGQFFKTPHHQSLSQDQNLSLIEVGLATTAAPTYFPIARNSRGAFVDGGVVGNAPGLFGWHEIRNFIAPHPNVNIRVLAVGTMSTGATMRGNSKLDRGIIGWGSALIDLMFSAQEASVDYMLSHLLGSDYFNIDDKATPSQNIDICALDVVSDAATNTLRDRGVAAAQSALGNPNFQKFLQHQAHEPRIYHGPNKNTEV